LQQSIYFRFLIKIHVRFIINFFLETSTHRFNFKRSLAEATLLLIPYLCFLQLWDFTEILPDTLFSSVDSQQYKAYGEYLTGSGDYASTTRPYLFPLFIKLCYVAGGSFGVWFVQALLHLWGGLLLFGVVRQTSKSVLSWFMVLFLYGAHPSLAVHTLHALTETVTIFLMALFVYFISRPPHLDSLRRVKAVAVLAVAVVVKPVFLYVFIIALVWLIWQEWSKLLRNRMKAAILGFSLAVFLIQPVLMKLQHGQFFVSKIGEITLRDYYFRLLYARAGGINFPLSEGPSGQDAVLLDNAVKNYTSGDILRFILANPLLAAKTECELVYSNIDSGSQLAGNIDGAEGLKTWGHFIRKCSLVAFLLALLSFLILLVKRKLHSLFPGFRSISLLLLYILLVSGISFWQGDRLVIFALPLWLAVYPALYIAAYRIFMSAKQTKINAPEKSFR
jgi:hypothetical protein